MKRTLIALFITTILILSSVATVSAKSDESTEPSFRAMEKTVFIHYKVPGKPPGTPGNGPGDKDPKPQDEDGYKLFRGGIKWAKGDTPVSYLVNVGSIPNLQNPNGVNPLDEIKAAFEVWDDATSIELFDDNPRTTDIAVTSPYDANVIYWTNLGDTNIIAVTTFWWYRGKKELAAFDMEFNTQFDWGIDWDGENTIFELTNAMDIRNITTHEAGHTLVLEDLYQDQFAQMTMYGYSTEGEVKKISLEAGDIAGVQALYGN